MRTVVLVGMRRAAIESAERLGLRIVLVVEAQPGARTASRVHRVVVSPFNAPPEAWAPIAASLRPLAPEATVALTERSVVAAAHLRAALGLNGLTPEAAHLCTHKGAMKRAVREAGLPCADFIEAQDGLGRDALIERLGLPLVVKPCIGSGGRGAYIVREREGVPDGLPHGWMAEAFVRGTEMSAEGFGWGGQLRAMNPTQYLLLGQASVAPAPLAAPEAEAVRVLHSEAWRALGVERGITHMETFLSPPDQGPGQAPAPVFGEMAARPPGGHLMRLISLAYQIDAWEHVFRIECGETLELPPAPLASAVWILHPGAGIVRHARGLEAVRECPGVAEATLRVGPGDRIERREGTGQEVGHIIVTAPTAPEAEARLRTAREALHLDVKAEA